MTFQQRCAETSPIANEVSARSCFGNTRAFALKCARTKIEPAFIIIIISVRVTARAFSLLS